MKKETPNNKQREKWNVLELKERTSVGEAYLSNSANWSFFTSFVVDDDDAGWA